MDQKIISDVFLRHLEALIGSLSEDLEGFCILSGKEEGSTKPKTKAMFIWLFGYDMIETIFIATKKKIIYLASQKKRIFCLSNFFLVQMMEEIKSRMPKHLELILIQKGNENKENLTKIRQLVGGLKIGMHLKEVQSGPLGKEWDEFKDQLNLVECQQVTQKLLAIKDEQELQFVNQSAQLTTKLVKRLISFIEGAIDVGNKVKHIDLAKKIEGILDQPTEKQKIIKELNLQDGLYDLAFTPIIQSGGQYTLSFGAQSNKENLSSDVITISLGTQVNEYNTACVRTLFINPTETQKKLYNALLEIQTLLIKLLVVGAKLDEVYKEVAQAYRAKLAEIGVNVDTPQSFGNGMGLEFEETHLSITETNTHEIQKNEVFLLKVYAENISGGQKGINYTIGIFDVAITTSAQPNVITNNVPKQYKQISYQLQEDDDQEDNKQQKPEKNQNGRTRGRREQKINQQRENEKQRQNHQADLMKKKQIELEQRLENDQFQQNSTVNKSLELDKLTCYRNADQFPKEAQKGQIYIDQQRAALLVPFQNSHLPFHVSCIKNVSKIDEGRIGSSIRINFYTTETSAGQIQFPTFDGSVIFIKELQYRSKKAERPQNLINQIKALQKKVKAEQQVEREKQHTGEMEPLILNRGGRRPAFKDLKIRPHMQQKGSGTLEVHTNGFRYQHSSSKETVDIIFKNIKHFIYQSPEHEIIAAIHFHLHSPIVLGRKKTQDVQFYCEVGGGVEHLEGRKKTNRNDDDEIEDEERSRQQRKRMAKEFEAFIKSIEEVGVDFKIQFDKPIRQLGFEGNWNRARIFLQPTLNTLMNVIESPFFILTLNEVEICCFERILPGIKSFDLVFVFKNYDKPVLRVESIDIKDLENVKNWLDKMDLLFFEVGQNLVWKNVLLQIQKDIAGFIQDGGWQNILVESDEEGVEQVIEEGDSEFSPGDSEDDESDYSDEDDQDVDDDGEGSDDDDDDDDDSEAIDLNELSDLAEEDSQDRKIDKKKPQQQRQQQQPPPRRPQQPQKRR